MPTPKTDIIEAIFDSRWDQSSGQLTDPVVTLQDVSEAIRTFNTSHPAMSPMSDRNPANFFKDFIRRKASANEHWPVSVFERGFTAKQSTGKGLCFEFVPIPHGQSEPFPLTMVPGPTHATPRHRIESASLPLASRRLGRSDESWLVQVLVRLRVIESHLTLFSARPFVQIDHLQMSVKLAAAEIDALFLGIETSAGGVLNECLITCEAKGRIDDILEDQIVQQVKAAFSLPEVTQDVIVPLAAKAIGPSEVYIVEFEAVCRDQSETYASPRVVSAVVFELVPIVEGIGR